MNKLVITKMAPVSNAKEVIVTAECQDLKLMKVDLEAEDKELHINSIYVGKVQKIVKNIQAAFIELEKGVVAYLPLSDLQRPIYVKKQGPKTLVAGDELLVQVIKEPIKTKAAVVTSNLNFSGKYFVITTGKLQFGISNKLDKMRGTQIKELLSEHRTNEDEFGVIVRTNANDASDENLLNEYKALTEQVRQILQYSIHRTCFSKVYEEGQGYLTTIKNTYMTSVDQIITDNTEIHENIKQYLSLYQPEDLEKLQFYEDRLLPLYKLYNLQLQIEDALKKHVWLKSGAYIIIEQTEAMVVIDVNTGKFDGGRKDREATFLKINKEAALEIARQIRLRNLSGMILIDFISMDNEASTTELIETLTLALRKDSIKTEFIDITKLGIVEVTRKKQKVALQQAINTLTDFM